MITYIHNPITNRRIVKGGYTNKKLIKDRILTSSSNIESESYMVEVKDPWKFFPRSKYLINHKLLKMTNIGIYSITKPDQAKRITDIIAGFFNNKINKLVITDATANMGGNTISFILAGFKVNIIEINSLTCDVIKNNLSVYKIKSSQYKFYCNNYIKIYKQLKQDIVFIDPPWGGVAYKKYKIFDLYLDQVNIIDICHELLINKLVKLIALKLPINFNYLKLFRDLTLKKFEIYKIYENKKHSFNICLCVQ